MILKMEKLALLFSGQGAQYVGMADKICKRYKIADEVFNEASEVLSIDLKDLANHSQDEITLTYNAQPLILTTSYAMYKAFCEEFDVKPTLMTGHSLGEVSALAAAGAGMFPAAAGAVPAGRRIRFDCFCSFIMIRSPFSAQNSLRRQILLCPYQVINHQVI